MTPAEQTWRRVLKPLLKLAVVLLLGWFMSGTLRQGIAQIEQEQVTLRPGWLILSGVLYLAGQLPSGMYWHRVLRRLGQEVGWGPTLRAYFIGHLGKYVPGKALVIVLRTALIRGAHVDTAVAAVSVFIETLTTMAVGAALAAGILAIKFAENRQLLLFSMGLFLAAGVPTLPPVFRFVIRCLRVGRANPLVVQRLDRLDYRTLLSGWVGITAGWVVMGGALWATLRGMDLAVPFWENLPLLVASVALAIVAGFASLIPGGAIVRELVLTELLTQVLAELPGMESAHAKGHALLSAVVLRLVTLVAELGISGILYGTHWVQRPLAADRRPPV
ncbi:MAG TPA: lysylphosphatidylglycerol synthase transmembrane domain-containing protein [Pirellulales bacterium]|nr:lysylphosphatidylglycerol synthase transmembrane domain-containing protein [Pirellulales bacterium]